MFVIYRVDFDDRLKPTYEKEKEVETLDEARQFLQEHQGDGNAYTVVME